MQFENDSHLNLKKKDKLNLPEKKQKKTSSTF